MRVGYYVHHHGLGHAARATSIARALPVPPVGFSTLTRPQDWPGEWVQLPADVPDDPVDPTAGGVLHWAPIGHTGHRERLRTVADRLPELDVMVVDTSAEVTLLSRLFGVRTVAVTPRGDRRDRAHSIAYDAADLLLAPWPASAPEPTWRETWVGKAAWCGAISRFDGVRRPGMPRAERRVLVVYGGGGTDVTEAQLQDAQAITPEWEWLVRTPDHPSPDLWRELAEASVVVTHGGNNAVAEVAAARAPAVVIAQPRPFGEQESTARAVQAAGCAVGLTSWPDTERWPALLARAQALGGEGWQGWHDGLGAQRAAAAIVSLAGGTA